MRSSPVQERLATILRDSFRDHQVWESAPDLCGHILAYAKRPAGMIRARLLLTTAKTYGKEIDAGMYDLAAATELLHLFALIHDDEIDTLKHSGIDQPPRLDDNHPESESGAIRVLAGDLVHALAQATLRRVVKNHGFPAEILDLAEEIAIKTISGQMLDIRFLDRSPTRRSETGTGDDTGTDTPDLDKLFTLYDMKTGYYTFVAPLCIGALCGDPAAAAADRGALTRTGLELGRAFQLRDDLEDVFSLQGQPVHSVRRWEYNLVHAFDPKMHIPPDEDELARLRQLAEPVLHDLIRAAQREAGRLSLPAPEQHRILEAAGAGSAAAGSVAAGSVAAGSAGNTIHEPAGGPK